MTPAPGIDPTALPPTRGPLTGGLISCALREARLKVSSTFSKVAGCRGGALARAPQSAELPCALISAGGGLRGNPRGGCPLFLYSSACAPFYWVGSLPCPAIRPHFFGACPKKRCRAAKEKRLFYPGGSTIRVSATASVVFTHLRPTWGGGWWLSERLPSPGANGICYGRFAQSVDLAGVTVVYRFRLPPKARFFGAPPRFFAQEQRNGVEWAGPALSIARGNGAHVEE